MNIDKPSAAVGGFVVIQIGTSLLMGLAVYGVLVANWWHPNLGQPVDAKIAMNSVGHLLYLAVGYLFLQGFATYMRPPGRFFAFTMDVLTSFAPMAVILYWDSEVSPKFTHYQLWVWRAAFYTVLADIILFSSIGIKNVSRTLGFAG